MLPKLLARLPERFQFTLHNVVAHPLQEILFQLGFRTLSDQIHDQTLPAGK